MSAHASLKHAEDYFVVRILLKLQRSAVLHELLELGGLAFAEVIQARLQLLLLDVAVFLVLGAAW